MAKYRQPALLAVMITMAAYFGGKWLLDNVIEGPMDEARETTVQLKKQIKSRYDALIKLQAASKVVSGWQGQSLPSDTDAARSLYQAWLVELVDDVKLLNPSVNSSEPVSLKGLFHRLTFSVRGRGTLEQMTTFMFAFYQTDLLHQIRSVNISPTSKENQLDLSIAIEALVVRRAGGAGSSEQETVFNEFRRRALRISDRLASDRLEDYEPIVRRNLFSVGGTGVVDPTDYTYLTSISIVNGEPQVWFTARATDEVMKLRQGDVFEVGTLVCSIAEVYGSDVIITSEDGERWLLTLGDRITDAHALPPEF
jgi:hypothetical protein